MERSQGHEKNVLKLFVPMKLKEMVHTAANSSKTDTFHHSTECIMDKNFKWMFSRYTGQNFQKMLRY